MKAVRSILAEGLLLLLSLSSFASAQLEGLYGSSLEVPPGSHIVMPGLQTDAQFIFHDLSSDSPVSLVPGAQPQGIIFHETTFRITSLDRDDRGWRPIQPGSLTTVAGQSAPRILSVRVENSASNPYFRALVNATTTTPQGVTFYAEAILDFFTPGIPGFTVLSGSPIQGLEPLEIRQGTFSVTNFAPLPRAFQMELTGNPCDLQVGLPAPFAIPPKGTVTVNVSVVGPDTRFDPLQPETQCLLGFSVSAADNPSQVFPASLSVKVTGLAVDPMLVFWTLVLLLLLLLLILLLKRRKEVLEEELLGKPQKPWTIPVEQVYLRHLKAKDERAWYVVRHFLMEDEYRSALLWYKSYKRGTKDARKRERLILRQEKAYAGWKEKWAKDIAKPIQKADKWEARLQAKLDRKARKGLRKEERRWRKLTAKLRQTHAKQQKRADERHAKLARRAAKKGLPAPRATLVPPPDLPLEPESRPVRLADHRWARKAARWRRAMAKRQGNLEVKFERADARRLAKLERKVQKLARKLDDPAFVEEHPLLKRPARQGA